MGIDIYLRWDLMTEDEVEKQFQGFDITIGNTGYLREAYHGEPYATMTLVPEAFDAHGDPTTIPAATLRERLPETMKLAMRRERDIYHQTPNEDSPAIQSFVEFVELAEQLESDGKSFTIRACY
jgi:hypothetical protein